MTWRSPALQAVAERRAEAELGDADVEVELRQQVLPGERRAAARVVHLVARLGSSSRVSSARCTSTSTGSNTSSVEGSAAASGSTGSPGRQREQPAEALERRGERRLRAHHRVARLRRLQLGAEHVELAREPDLEPRLRGLQQRLGALQALARHLEQLALRDHRVEGRRHVDRGALAREQQAALLALHARGARS